LDAFNKNIIIVFLGSTITNFINLLYQLLIAHNLNAADFAAFNSLLSIFMLISSPIGTFQAVIAKYSSEFRARNELEKVHTLLFVVMKNALICGLVSFLILYFLSPIILDRLKINSSYSGLILAILVAASFILPVLSGGLQGAESFKWFSFVQIISGIAKLLLTALFLYLGFSISGALGGLMLSSLAAIGISVIPLKKLIKPIKKIAQINFQGILIFVFPVAISYFCFIALVTFDMVQVKYFFDAESSGVYSLAQMIGKIFLFLPGAISIVMFPRVSGLNARNLDTSATLKYSLLIGALLCLSAVIFYNIFPDFVLRLLTGKAPQEAIFLGRFFGISMSFFTLMSILMTYFLSIKDLRFIKYLVTFTALQFLAIAFMHTSLLQVLLILCVNSVFVFGTLLLLANFPKKR